LDGDKVAALQGRFRQSRFTPLAADEATAFYRHLWDCPLGRG
jgi:hypothetical protein